MTAHITWTNPSTRADPPTFTPFAPGTILTASVYDTASATPTVPVWQGNALPGGQSAIDLPAVPGSTHGYYVVVSDGTLQSTPSATIVATAPSAPPNPPTNVTVTFT